MHPALCCQFNNDHSTLASLQHAEWNLGDYNQYRGGDNKSQASSISEYNGLRGIIAA